MSAFLFITVVQAIVAALLIGVILMQRSEGGGLGVGGNPGGMMSVRGAADFLTRATKWLAVVFVGLSITLAALAVRATSTGDVTSTINRDVKTQGAGTAPAMPNSAGQGGTTDGAESAPATTGGVDPLSDPLK